MQWRCKGQRAIYRGRGGARFRPGNGDSGEGVRYFSGGEVSVWAVKIREGSREGD